MPLQVVAGNACTLEENTKQRVVKRLHAEIESVSNHLDHLRMKLRGCNGLYFSSCVTVHLTSCVKS